MNRIKIGLTVLIMVMVVGGVILYQFVQPKSEILVFNPSSVDQSIYHKPGSNNADAIKNGEWTILYKFRGQLKTFPYVGKLTVNADDLSIYEDKNCVFAVAWDSSRISPDSEDLKEDNLVWSKFWDSGKNPEYEQIAIVRIYKEKRRVFQICTLRQRLILTMPEDPGVDPNMYQLLSDSESIQTPTPTVVIK